MYRVIEYRGRKIDVELVPAAPDTFNVFFRIDGSSSTPGVHEFALVRDGPFSGKLAYAAAETEGRAAIDLVLGPQG